MLLRAAAHATHLRTQMLWAGLFEKHGGKLAFEFDLSTLAHITEGYASGHIDTVVRSVLTASRRTGLATEAVSIPEILAWLCRVCARSRGLLCNLRAAETCLAEPPES
jgi:hypothetical protein